MTCQFYIDTTGMTPKPAGHVVVPTYGITPGKVSLTFSDYVEEKQNIEGTLTLGSSLRIGRRARNIINTEIKTNTGEYIVLISM